MKYLISDKIKIIGHRGSAGPFPENTPEAVLHGIKSGAEMIEIDIRLCKDNEIVLSHDENIKRITGIDQNISEINWKELSQIKIKKNKQLFHIPGLKEIFRAVPKNIYFYLELKATKKPFLPDRDKKLVDKTIGLIKKGKMKKQTILMSFNEKIFLYLKKNYPSYFAGMILKTEDQIYYYLNKKRFKFDCLAIKQKALTKNSLKALKTSGIPFIVWTVNSKKLWNKVASYKPMGIVTDYPDKFSD